MLLHTNHRGLVGEQPVNPWAASWSHKCAARPSPKRTLTTLQTDKSADESSGRGRTFLMELLIAYSFSGAEISLKTRDFSVVVANLRTFKLGTRKKNELFTLQ